MQHDNASQDDSDPVSNEINSRNAEDGDSSSVENQKESETSIEETEQGANAITEEKLDFKDESCEQEIPAEQKAKSVAIEEKDNAELNDLSLIIGEKLKFLSEGRESVSAVQTMQIQLQVSLHSLV